MKRRLHRGRDAVARSHRARRVRGVVLFVALLVLVVLGLASVALFRSVDTATLVAGNLASKQAAIAAVDRGIEHAVDALWAANAPITDRTRHDPGRNYYACARGSADACVTPGSAIPEIPVVLASPAQFTAAGLNPDLVADDAAGHRSVYVIERMCLATGPPLGSLCNLPAVAPAGNGTTQQEAEATPAPDAFYRVTVKVSGPRNTTAIAQAMLRPPQEAVRKHRVAWRLVPGD